MDKLTPLQLVQSNSLTMIIQDEMEKLILRGEIDVGGRLNESELAQRFGISRGPIREAFRGLEESGLVRQEKNRGAFVREISIEEADEIYDLREAMEDLIGRKLAQHISEEQLAELRRQVEHMEEIAASKDAALYHPLNLQFHDTLASFTGNGKLLAVYRKLTKELLLFRLRGLSAGGGMAVSSQEHRDIVDAIAARDGEKAGATLRRHAELSRARMHRAVNGAPN
ncbi:phosphonate utilization associated transcriptional regulator [Herbaspirillum rhizosphaerae]|uniref:phosphonate utilization associated transcriptional regulator n=1 Tax=Herbaspirillum rhizosphaerae TaxID=346179 RepID=UPI00067C22A4|nr:phosphonate utilization associated transcriptional regulator [Herbaspirillum rhizosphaerae]